MYCKKCGRQIPDDAPFCTACGVPTKNFAASVASAPKPVAIPTAPARTPNTWTWKYVLAAIALVVCLLHLVAALYMAEVAGLICAGAFLVIAATLFAWGQMSRRAALNHEKCKLPWWVVLLLVGVAYAVVMWASANADRWNTYSTPGAIPVEPAQANYDGLFAFGPGLLLVAVIVVVVCFVVKRKSQAERNDEPTYQRAADAAQMRQEELRKKYTDLREQMREQFLHRNAIIAENCTLAYHYDDVDVAGVEYRDINYSHFSVGDDVLLEAEPENPHDAKAIKVNCYSEFLGYLHRGTLQQMVHDYWDREWPVTAKIVDVHEPLDEIVISLSFYKPKG